MKMKIQQVLNCSFSSWYKLLERETFKSEVIPIPQEVLKYLLSDGIVLPESAKNGTSSCCQEMNSDSEDGSSWDADEPDAYTKVPYFPAFEEKVRSAIRRLGGKVFPKLNWSSPRDATWVAMNNSLMCTTPGDIFLLLKSSDFVTRDLTQPFIHCDNCTEGQDINYELVLRRWNDISPGGEFRCFVRKGVIIAVCQRSQSVYFPHIESVKDQIIEDITRFHRQHIVGKFPDNDYVFDVYRKDAGDLKLIDFNPFGECTDSLLYTWAELKLMASDEYFSSSLPDFRYQNENRGVQPSEFQMYALPRDFIDICSGEDVNKLIDVMKLHEQIAGSSSDEEATPDVRYLEYH